MEYVRLALLIVQLLNALKERDKGQGVTAKDIAGVAEAAEGMGLIKASEVKDAKEDMNIIQQLLQGIGELFDGEDDKPKPKVVSYEEHISK